MIYELLASYVIVIKLFDPIVMIFTYNEHTLYSLDEAYAIYYKEITNFGNISPETLYKTLLKDICYYVVEEDTSIFRLLVCTCTAF